MKPTLSQEIGGMRDRILNKSWKKIVVALVLTTLVVGGTGFILVCIIIKLLISYA